MHKFFVEEDQIREDKVYIKDGDLKHIDRVLRLKKGAEVMASCNGSNYICVLDEIKEDRAILNIVSKFNKSYEAPIDILLYQGFPKASKMDLIVQKGTEIGIKDFYGIISHRSIVQFKDDKKKNSKIERLNAIIKEAAKQSKRDYIPEISGIYSFKTMIKNLKGEKNIIVAYEDEENMGLKQVLKSIEGDRIHLVIGPEGGFEKWEIDSLREIGGKIVSLGPRILRTETAGIVAASIILYELGDLGVNI